MPRLESGQQDHSFDVSLANEVSPNFVFSRRYLEYDCFAFASHTVGSYEEYLRF